MFQDYSFLVWHLKELNSELRAGSTKNRYHQHLEWLVEVAGENRTVQFICRQCRQKPISVLSVVGDDRYGYSIGLNYSSCDNPICRQQIEALALDKSVDWLPVKFSSINQFGRKSDQQNFTWLLRTIFNLPRRITAPRAFEFFTENTITANKSILPWQRTDAVVNKILRNGVVVVDDIPGRDWPMTISIRVFGWSELAATQQAAEQMRHDGRADIATIILSGAGVEVFWEDSPPKSI